MKMHTNIQLKRNKNLLNFKSKKIISRYEYDLLNLETISIKMWFKEENYTIELFSVLEVDSTWGES